MGDFFFSNIDVKYVELLQIRNMRNMGNQLSLAALLMDKWDKQRNSFNNVCQLDSTFQHFLNVCQLCKYAFEPTSMQLIEIGLKSNRHNAVWMTIDDVKSALADTASFKKNEYFV